MLSFFREKKSDIFFIVFFLICFVLASRLMPLVAISFSKSSGLTAKADILLGSVISLSLLRGKKYASYYALVSGFLFDVIVGNPYSFSPVVFFLCAYFAGLAASPFSHKTPLSVLLASAMLLWVRALFSFFYLIAVSGDSGAGDILLFGVLPEYIANILITTLVFSVMRILMAVFRIPTREDIEW